MKPYAKSLRLAGAMLLALVIFSAPVQAQQLSWWSVAFPADPFRSTIIEGQARALAEQIPLPEDASFYAKVDSVRHFINTHSAHLIDDEFYSYWHDIPRLMTMISTRATNQDAPLPHMECSTRTAVMYWLLKALGIKARLVVIYPDQEPVEGSHTFLEAYNPERRSWEIQDPDYGIYWIFKHSQERASVEELMSHPVEENFVPCRATGACGYDNHTKILPQRFAVAFVMDLETKDHPLLVNYDRADVAHLLLKSGLRMPYCALFKDECYKEVIVFRDAHLQAP